MVIVVLILLLEIRYNFCITFISLCSQWSISNWFNFSQWLPLSYRY